MKDPAGFRVFGAIFPIGSKSFETPALIGALRRVGQLPEIGHEHCSHFPDDEPVSIRCSHTTFCVGVIMRETRVTVPELAMIAGTRAALGAGLGLLLADRLDEGQRRAVGWTLVAVGALCTIPLAFEVLGGGRFGALEEWRRYPEMRSRSRADDRPVQKGAPVPT